MKEQKVNISRELGNTEKNETVLKNTVSEIENTLDGIKDICYDTEEWTSYLEGREVGITQAELKKEKRF